MVPEVTRYIAETGSNHNGRLERALALVEAAAEVGFTDVKTQAFVVDKLFSKEALEARPGLAARRRFEVPWEWHKPLANRCYQLGMRYGVSLFSADTSLARLTDADWLKVSSYSLLDHRLIRRLAASPLPLVISTGMATEAEVASALEAIPEHLRGREYAGVTLLHCVSAYPALAHETNLRSIPYMRGRFGVDVGWSDHTCSPHVLDRAVRIHGATMIEVHFDLDDRRGDETGHSWTPASWRRRHEVDYSDHGYYACDGKRGVKAPSVSEEFERSWRADPSDGLRPLLAERARLASRVPAGG